MVDRDRCGNHACVRQRGISCQGVSAAKGRQVILTRPRGLLGVLANLGTRLCDMYGEWSPPLAEPVVMAAGISDKK